MSEQEFGPKCPIHGPGCPGTCNEAADKYADELIVREPKSLASFLDTTKYPEGQNYFTARNWTPEQSKVIIEKLTAALKPKSEQ